MRLLRSNNSTNGSNWTRSNSWLSEEPLGNWRGVTTDENGRVTELRLSSNGMSGPISVLGALSNLTALELSSNQLTGSIPNLWRPDQTAKHQPI